LFKDLESRTKERDHISKEKPDIWQISYLAIPKHDEIASNKCLVIKADRYRSFQPEWAEQAASAL